MTTTQILQLHEISFLNKEEQNSSSIKFFLGGGEMETFFFFLSNPENIETEVIPVLNHYLNGNPFPIDNDLTVGGADLVEVTLDGVKFIDRQTLVEDQIVPLDQFKAIALAWIDYLRNQ